jgi:preprotein translocase subunit YajC
LIARNTGLRYSAAINLSMIFFALEAYMKAILGLLIGSFLTVQGAMACPSYNGVEFCKGDRVLTQSGWTGYIQEVFSNGKAVVDRDNYSADYTLSISSLGKGVPCFKKFCKNKRVITVSNWTGYIQEVFSNGKAVVDRDNYSADYTLKVSSLGLGYRCSGNLCVNDRVLTQSGWTGYAQEIFNNGKVVVDRDNYSADYALSISSLGYELNCYN